MADSQLLPASDVAGPRDPADDPPPADLPIRALDARGADGLSARSSHPAGVRIGEDEVLRHLDSGDFGGVERIRCIGCGSAVPAIEGPVHRYMDSSPGCWRLYGDILAREYSDPAYRAVHRLTVDSYAVQHPGRPSPQAIRSVALHLMSLCLVLERGADLDHATRKLQTAARRKERFRWLEPPTSLGAITVADVARASSPLDHATRVRAWAESAWSAWAPHHETVRDWWLPG